MGRRRLTWTGVLVTLLAAMGLGVYWRVKGLEEAGWLAGVLGALSGLAALALTLLDRMPPHPAPAHPDEPEPEDANRGWRASGGEPTINTISGGVNIGPLIMGRDITVSGHTSPQRGATSAEGPPRRGTPGS